MANIRLIKRRIKSAQNISQITRAMEMVAASKMKKAQENALMGKPYAEKIYRITKTLALKTDEKVHPLLAKGNINGKVLVILITTNKGLCGGLNTNLFRMVYGWLKDKKDVDFVTVGKKGQSFIVKTHGRLIADFSENLPFTSSVPAQTQLLVDGFIKGVYKEVYIAYNSFVNALKYLPVNRKILPISEFEESESAELSNFSEFIIEPNINEVLESLLPHYLENQIRAAILESEASEQSARMIAMKNATDAADDFTSELTLLFNKARQEKITFEIADMVTARMAVE